MVVTPIQTIVSLSIERAYQRIVRRYPNSKIKATKIRYPYGTKFRGLPVCYLDTFKNEKNILIAIPSLKIKQHAPTTLHASSCMTLIEMWIRKLALCCFERMKTEKCIYTTRRKQSSFVNVWSLDLAVIDFILVSWFLTLNRFHILFSCFHCWFLTSKCRLWNVLFLEGSF